MGPNNPFMSLGDVNQDIDTLVGDLYDQGDADDYIGEAARKIEYTPFIDIKGGVLTSANIQATSQFPMRERKESIRTAQRFVAYQNYQATANEVAGVCTFNVRSSLILNLAPTTAPGLFVPLIILQIGISAYQGVPGGNYIVEVTSKDFGLQAFTSGQIVIAQSEAYSNLVVFTAYRLIAGNPYPIMLYVQDASATDMVIKVSGLQTSSKCTLTIPGANHRAINALLRS